MWFFTIFLSSFLMFILEFSVAKLVLPILGGTPAVWTASVVFYQFLLLVGYFLAHRFTQVFRQSLVWLPVGVGVLALLQIPIRLPSIVPGLPPVIQLWLLLGLSIGLIFLQLSLISPILQDWLSRIPGQNPYSLYAVSNLGSFSSLILYPTLIETQMTLTQQCWFVSVLYVVVLGFLARLYHCFSSADDTIAILPQPISPQPDGKVRLLWVILSALPTSLMLSVTSVITIEVSNTPLIWSIPMGLYLMTLTFVFGSEQKPKPRFWNLKFVAGATVLLLIVAFTVLTGTTRMIVDLLGLTIIAFLLHHRLYEIRPSSDRLTSFYFYIALGGLLGGLFNSVVAPLVFQNGVTEYPLTLICSLLLLLHGHVARDRWRQVNQFLLSSTLILVLVLGFSKSPDLIGSYRNFFGIYKITRVNDFKVIIHNTTVHGAQKLTSTEPISYYSVSSGIGELMTRLNQTSDLSRVGVIGLGSGGLYAYAQPQQKWRFIEIDPLVVSLAQTYFDYLCSGSATYDVVVGDGRTQFNQMLDQLDLLVLDAFSSDIVPPHLLNTQSLSAYLQKVKPSGLMAFNLSNRYLDLRDVVANASDTFGLVTFVKSHTASLAESKQGITSSTWAVVVDPDALSPDLFQLFQQQWQLVSPTANRVWTDDYSNLVPQFTAFRQMRQRLFSGKSPSPTS